MTKEKNMEAAPRIELGMKVLQTSALPLGYGAVWVNLCRSYTGCLNPFPKLCVRIASAKLWSGRRGSNPLPLPWQGSALPNELLPRDGASEWSRTTDTGIFSPLLYQLSYRGKNLATRRGLEPLTFSVTG